MTTVREQRIRQRAHRIWEQSGSPDGQEAQHWQQAEREIDAEDAPASQPATPGQAPAAKGKGKPRKKKVDL